jgi:peptidase S58-like protein
MASYPVAMRVLVPVCAANAKVRRKPRVIRNLIETSIIGGHADTGHPLPVAGLLSAQTLRPRARELGITVGVLPPGPLNAITDVAGVVVGHTTVIRGSDIRTGVTAILPHTRNLFREKVGGAVFIGNAFGKLAGSTQVEELGEAATVGSQGEYYWGGAAGTSFWIDPKEHMFGVFLIQVLLPTNIPAGEQFKRLSYLALE